MSEMTHVQLEIGINPHQLAASIIKSWKREEVMEFIKFIDDSYADYDFTKDLADHFTKVIEEEDAAINGEKTENEEP